MKKFELNMDLWPLVRSSIGDGLSDADYDEMFRGWESVFVRKQRFVAMTDATRSQSMGTSKQRARIAEWTRDVIEPLSIKYSLGHAMVISNPLVRGAMTAIGWVHKPASPQVFVGSQAEGCAWCIEQLRAGGVAVTPAIEAYCKELERKRA